MTHSLPSERPGDVFEFHDPGPLVDDDLELVLVEKYPGDPLKEYVPAYRFKMTHAGQAHRGHRYAAKACRLLLPLARSHAMESLWITCNPDNVPSRRTCELAGAELVEIVDLPEEAGMYRAGERQKCRYRIDL